VDMVKSPVMDWYPSTEAYPIPARS
jgi:hypothetical protein